jgi:hypothetical protein
MSDITFPDAVDGIISCNSKPHEDGVKIKVGPLLGTRIGDVLKLDWQGYSDHAGEQPIPGTQTSFIHFITEPDITDGVEKTVVNWEEHIKPIKMGSARVTYTINGGGGKTAQVPVFLLNAEGLSCDEVKV